MKIELNEIDRSTNLMTVKIDKIDMINKTVKNYIYNFSWCDLM